MVEIRESPFVDEGGYYLTVDRGDGLYRYVQHYDDFEVALRDSSKAMAEMAMSTSRRRYR
jgi:hypothetical protein